MPRTAAQYPSTTSPASSSTAGSSAVATPVASRALSVWTNPPALDVQGSGVADAGAVVVGVATLFQNTSFDGAQSAHFAAHRDLRLTGHVEDWLGQIAHKVVLAVAVWDPRKLGGDGLDERILLVRHPRPHRLGQALSPLTRQDDQPAHLRLRTGEQGLGKPHPLALEFAHHIERLMPFFRLQPVDRQ